MGFVDCGLVNQSWRHKSVPRQYHSGEVCARHVTHSKLPISRSSS